MRDYKRYFLIAVFIFGVFFSTNAQHYFFIESDSQQAFYIKKSDTLYSSSANGFLIIPKNTEKTFSITVGFPRNKYPEAVFKLEEMDKDRGFQLKNFQEKGWGLFDRSSFQIIMQVTSDVLKEKIQPDSSQKEGTAFANMLSEATDDKSLLKKEKTVLKSPQKSLVPKQIAKPITEIVKSDAKALPVAKKIPNTITQVKIDSSDKGILSIKYLDKSSDGKTDVVDLKIEVSNNVEVIKVGVDSISSNAKGKQTSALNTNKLTDSSATDYSQSEPGTPVNCSLPLATEKDVKNIQRKLLGYIDGEEQLKFTEKSYKAKCFTTTQTMEISWFLLNEDLKLGFFEKVLKHISDQENIKLLESGFVKEENIIAFRALLSIKN